MLLQIDLYHFPKNIEKLFFSNNFAYIFVFLFVNLTTDFFFFFSFLQPHPWHMEGPRLGVELVLQLQAYATAMATPESKPLQPTLQ